MLCFGIDANYLNAQVFSPISHIETHSTDDLTVSSKNACNNQDEICFLDWSQQLPFSIGYTLHNIEDENMFWQVITMSPMTTWG